MKRIVSLSPSDGTKTTADFEYPYIYYLKSWNSNSK